MMRQLNLTVNRLQSAAANVSHGLTPLNYGLHDSEISLLTGHRDLTDTEKVTHLFCCATSRIGESHFGGLTQVGHGHGFEGMGVMFSILHTGHVLQTLIRGDIVPTVSLHCFLLGLCLQV